MPRMSVKPSSNKLDIPLTDWAVKQKKMSVVEGDLDLDLFHLICLRSSVQHNSVYACREDASVTSFKAVVRRTSEDLAQGCLAHAPQSEGWPQDYGGADD